MEAGPTNLDNFGLERGLPLEGVGRLDADVIFFIGPASFEVDNEVAEVVGGACGPSSSSFTSGVLVADSDGLVKPDLLVGILSPDGIRRPEAEAAFFMDGLFFVSLAASEEEVWEELELPDDSRSAAFEDDS